MNLQPADLSATHGLLKAKPPELAVVAMRGGWAVAMTTWWRGEDGWSCELGDIAPERYSNHGEAILALAKITEGRD